MEEEKLKEMIDLLKMDSRQDLTKISKELDLPVLVTFEYLKRIKEEYIFTIIKKKLVF